MSANRLIREKSPYLLQHAHNPVDWYPWGEEAFEKSRREDKPILLSIGYSTCHWCHVMEKESFEDLRTARLMNEGFVAVKVDREERPDIDHLYINYVTATTGGGGWPMTVFLTPDQKPFYGGTYFPPEDRFGIPGFRTLLGSMADAWKTRRAEILESADSAAAFLKNQEFAASPGKNELSAQTLDAAFERAKSAFDPGHGGFGGAPKFPRSHALSLLLRHWRRSNHDEALRIAETTLKAMARGGMHDQIGGGFHRYSTDRQWRIPHFEKMLYDQALLAKTYLEAYQATRGEEYAAVARKTLEYVLRIMTDSDGGFFSAEDADSPDPRGSGEKKEGAYYLWTENEIEKCLPKDSAAVVAFHYGIAREGNAIADPHREFEGLNVLYRAHSIPETAAHFKIRPEEVETIMTRADARLLEVRAARPSPHRDDKVLADWNGLVIAAFALAGRILEEPRYTAAAERAARFIRDRLKDPHGRLLHRWRDGEAAIRGNLSDYSFFIEGCLELYQATFDERWLEEARADAETMIRFFWDSASGGFFLTARDAETLIARPKDLYDGAVPSGNSVAALDLLRLDRFTADGRFREYAEKIFAAFGATVAGDPASYPQFLAAVDEGLGPSTEIVIAGDPDDATVRAMLREIHLRFFPNKIIMLHRPGPAGRRLEAIAPYVKAYLPVGGKPAAYVCRNHACELPVTGVAELKKLLDRE